MNKGQKFRYVLLGVILCFTVTQLATPALAALTKKTIEVFTGVSVYIDDQKFTPTDANGNAVEPILYNGTTYLPLRAVSQALGVDVNWDNATKTVYLGDHYVAPTPSDKCDYSKYVGTWTGTGLNGSTETLELSINNGNLYMDYTSRSGSRAATVSAGGAISELGSDTLTIENYSDDWGNNGTMHIEFRDGCIVCTFENVKNYYSFSVSYPGAKTVYLYR